MRRRKKMFRHKRRYGAKKRYESALKIIAGAAAVAALVFVGYSAAGPISRYIAQRAEQSEAEPWTPASETDTVSDPSGTAEESAHAEESVSSETQQTDLTLKNETEAQTSAPTENSGTAADTSGTEPPAASETATETAQSTEKAYAPNVLRSGGAAYSVSAEDMNDMESLKAALKELRINGCTAAILPMKTEGGIFHYKTDIDFVDTVIDGDDPVVSELTASEIAKAAEAEGLRPAALISVLYDNNRYGDYRDGSYRSLDDSTWLDTSPEKGGKPWLSPFDPVTREYLCDIVRELSEAGFKEIICDDFIFPEFRSSDIELLGEDVSPYGDRHLALSELAVMLTETGAETGAQVMLRITANSVIKNYSELFYPYDLQGCSIIIDYSENNISRTMVYNDSEYILDGMDMYEKTSAIYKNVTSQCLDMETFPMIEEDSMSADDFSKAVKALTDMGYDRYYVY